MNPHDFTGTTDEEIYSLSFFADTLSKMDLMDFVIAIEFKLEVVKRQSRYPGYV